MIEAFKRLYDQFAFQMRSAADGGAGTTKQMFDAMGVDQAAFLEGGLEFKRVISADPTLEDVGIAFAFAFARGHAAGVRRAAMAASVPEARGREAELFGWLVAGQSVDAAVAKLRLKGEQPPHAGNVITLPVRERSP